MILGIDHGYGMIKTEHTAFVAGVTEYQYEPPIEKRVVKFDGKYYVLGGERQSLKQDKTANKDYYLMTLGAIAEELKLRNVTQADVTIAAGLPLAMYGEQKTAFKRYLTQRDKVNFGYEGVFYSIRIIDAILFPQGYAAVAPQIKQLTGTYDTVLVDMGSYTVDICILAEYMPNIKTCKSLPIGTITAINTINEELRRRFSTNATENQIIDIMRKKECKMPKDFLNIIEDGVKRYGEEVMEKVGEVVPIKTTPVIYVGGASCVIENYCDYDEEMTTIITDINANAKGYAALATARCKGANKQ